MLVQCRCTVADGDTILGQYILFTGMSQEFINDLSHVALQT